MTLLIDGDGNFVSTYYMLTKLMTCHIGQLKILKMQFGGITIDGCLDISQISEKTYLEQGQKQIWFPFIHMKLGITGNIIQIMELG